MTLINFSANKLNDLIFLSAFGDRYYWNPCWHYWSSFIPASSRFSLLIIDMRKFTFGFYESIDPTQAIEISW
jgi:hypothetical protein